MKQRPLRSIADLEGLGPRSAAALRRVGIRSVEDLRACDPFEVYARLKTNVPGTSLNFLYGIIGAIDGLPWQEVKRTRRMEILLRLDELGLAPK